jgi:small subunit ribosomal protein S17
MTEKEMKKKVKCEDSLCPTHGGISLRGRTFKGKVISKFPKRISIELERIVYIKKYERYKKLRTKLHARLPDCLIEKINIGDYVEIMECRKISKIINFVVVKKLSKEGIE